MKIILEKDEMNILVDIMVDAKKKTKTKELKKLCLPTSRLYNLNGISRTVDEDFVTIDIDIRKNKKSMPNFYQFLTKIVGIKSKEKTYAAIPNKSRKKNH